MGGFFSGWVGLSDSLGERERGGEGGGREGR